MEGASHGRPYTQREYKAIIDYIKDRKAYDKVRGRTMWFEFASSNLTTRTWQSLKETFRKRILPRIQDPYFKLTKEEIRSFRSEKDLTNKNVNKLEFEEDKSTSEGNDTAKPQPSTSRNKAKGEDNISGEENQVLKVTSSRESVETIRLSPENCYNNAEELLNVLESPAASPHVKSSESPRKTRSLRDCITYSEPLTPLLQQIIEDFESEDEVLQAGKHKIQKDPENAQDNVEQPQKTENQGEKNNDEVEPNGNNNCVSEAPESPTKKQSKLERSVNEKITRAIKNISTESNESDVQVLENDIPVQEIVDTATEETSNDVASQSILRHKSDLAISKEAETKSDAVAATNNETRNRTPSENPNSHITVQDSSTTITDSLIPNNQEALPMKANLNEIVSSKKSEAQKGNDDEVTINEDITCSKPGNVEKLEKGPKRQRKLFSVVQSEIAVSKEKRTTLSELNEDLNNKQPTTNTNNINAKTSKHVKFLDKLQHMEKITQDVGNAGDSKSQEDIMDTQESLQSTNPCLQSVSLFAEQNMPTEIESDSDDIDTRKNNPISTIAMVHKENQSDTELNNKVAQTEKSKKVQEDANSSGSARNSVSLEKKVDSSTLIDKEDVILLKSHSDTDSTEDIQITRKKSRKEMLRRQKKEVLNDLFGSTSGVVSKRRRIESERNGSVHTKQLNRKRISHTVGGLPHERVLYVASGKQWDEGPIYHYDGEALSPLEAQALHYDSYASDHASDEEDSIWKLKYVQERKRNESLKKLLESVSDGCADSLLRSATTDSPIIPFKSSVKPKPIILENGTKAAEELKGIKELGPREAKGSVIKTKVEEDYVEIYVECRRERLQTALQFVMQELNMDAPTSEVVAKACASNKRTVPIEVSSGNTTPLSVQVDEEARKKTLALENEILKKIEEADKSDMDLKVTEHVTERFHRIRRRKDPDEDSLTSSTVTKAKQVKTSVPSLANITNSVIPSPKQTLLPTDSKTKPKPAKISTESANSTEKQSETSTESATVKLPTESKAKMNGHAATSTESRTRGRRSKIASGSKNNSDVEVGNERLLENAPGQSRRRGRPAATMSHDSLQPRRRNTKDQAKIAVPEDDSQVLYKFPSPEPEVDNSVAKKTSTITTRARKYLPRTPEMISSSDNSQNTTESSQGYQDSDLTPLTGTFMRKKKYSLPTSKANEKYKFTRNFRRHTFNHFETDTSSESSNSNFRFPIKNATVTNSSLSTEVYRSESYQLLMPKTARACCPLEQISESPCPNEVDPECDENCLKLSPASQNLGSRSEAGNSSNVSLPLSPELSIVESISISKNDLAQQPDRPTINETMGNVEMKSVCNESYVISNVDVSIPLMQQKCDFYIYQDTGISNLSEGVERQSTSTNVVSQVNEVPAFAKCNSVTDSLLDRMDTASTEQNVTTNDLDVRLRNILLESAKKIAEENKKAIEMSSKQVETKKIQSKKRCSTPRKKKETKKSQTPKEEPVIEECMEYCQTGRKSCPPVICDTENITTNATETVIEINNPTKTKKSSNPKEIIKVKILRPKKKGETFSKKPSTSSRSTLSVLTDSAINDTSVSILLQSMNESVDFIHNHSETCLQANDCVTCIVESDAPKSIPSVGTSSDSGKENIAMMRRRNVRESMTPEFFCCDAQSGSCFEKISQEPSQKPSQTGSEYHSAQCSSLITEDLSDEAATPNDNFNKWYLLSEDETTNSSHSTAKPATCSMNSGYSSNLRQLFPVICSVPDLSDITEFSRETDGNSRKSTRNTDLDSNNNVGTMGTEFMGSDFNDTFI